MPPGKHKSKLKTALINEAIGGPPFPLFLSRQGSRVDQPHLPIFALSRQQSLARQSEQMEPSDIQQHVIRKINVNLLVQSENKQYELGDVNCKITEDDNQLWVYDLIRNLKTMPGCTHFENSSIQILNEDETSSLVNHCQYTPNLPVYQNIGTDPLPQNCYIKICSDQTQIQLRVRPAKSSLLDCILEQQPSEETNQKKNQKTKQRSLSQVVERVALWRRLYTGFYDQNKTFIQMSLDKAAEKVGISKKTLDDYLLQIRYGKRYGFDFKKHSVEGISKLRQFVKQKKEKKTET